MSLPSTESTPVPERLLPQTSIRFILFLIGVSALVMYTYRAAFVADQMWAKIGSLLITTVGGCFFFYAALFLVANSLSRTTAPLRNLLRSRDAEPETQDANRPQGHVGESSSGDT